MPFFSKSSEPPFHPPVHPYRGVAVSAQVMEQAMADCADFCRARLKPGSDVFVFYIDGLVSSLLLSEGVLKPLAKGFTRAADMAEAAVNGAVEVTCRPAPDMEAALNDLLNGFCVLVCPGGAASMDVRGADRRSISEPANENVVKGARDSFVETLRINTALVRSRVHTSSLKFRERVIGRQTGTRISLVYMDGLTDPELIKKVEARLDDIDVDRILTTSGIDGYLVDARMSAFPRIIYTERVDRFAGGLLDGRVGLFVNGIPGGMLMPVTLATLMRSADDYEKNYLVASGIIALRYLALLLALFLPGFYVAVTSFHQEMIPTPLMQSIIASKENVPFTTAIEVFILLISFEILVEAGIRLPQTVGQAVSIVGALVVGQATVEAQIISPVVVIIIALAGICGFALPDQDFAGAIRLWRMIFLASGAAAGLFGLMSAAAVLVWKLSGLETFDVPYLSPFAGGRGSNILNVISRRPVRDVKLRHTDLNPVNLRRQK